MRFPPSCIDHRQREAVGMAHERESVGMAHPTGIPMTAERDSTALRDPMAPAEHTSADDDSTPHADEGPREAEAVDDGDHEQPAGGESLRLLLDQGRAFFAALMDLATAKADGLKLSVRNALLSTTLAALGFIAVCGLIISASWLVLRGMAEGLGILFGGRPWLGAMVTGLLALAGLALGAYVMVTRWKTAARNRTIQKHEQRQARQRARQRGAAGGSAPAASDDR